MARGTRQLKGLGGEGELDSKDTLASESNYSFLLSLDNEFRDVLENILLNIYRCLSFGKHLNFTSDFTLCQHVVNR